MNAKILIIINLITFLLLLVVPPLFSQQINLKGKIVDEKTHEVLSFASIELTTQDSTFVKRETSDDKGNFSISAISSGNYLLSVSFLGYNKSIIKLANLYTSVDLGEIDLQQNSQTLNEVVVEGNNTINKVDRQVILPTPIQIKSSNSGYELLNNLMLPGLRIDPIQNTISAIGGGNVQVRINDVIASVTQVKALRPANVLRVEYIDDPGVRYGDENVSAVINFIVKQMESGVSINTDLQNAPFVGFGNNLLSLRANHRKSQFGIDYFLSYRDYKKRYNDREERYIFPDMEMQRNLIGIEQPFSYQLHSIEASYNLTQPSKYVFNAVFKDEIYNSPNNNAAYIIFYADPNTPDASSYQHAVMKSNTPSIDLFYKLYMPQKQSIALNAVGTYIHSLYDRSYTEYQDNITSSNYAYSTDGKKYSFIGEGIYDKEFKPFKFTSGLKYSQSYTNNQYTGSTDATTTLHNSNLYAYVQLQGNLKKINYQIGVGFSRSQFSEETDAYSFYTFQPIVSLSYSFLKTSFLRYRFSIMPLLPSLSQLSNIRQDLDDFQVNEGNPNMKPYRLYRNSILYRYKQKLLTGTLTGMYDYYKNPIMDEVYREDGSNGSVFVYSYDNQKKYQQLGSDLNLTYGPVKNIVTMEVEGGVNRYFSTGNNYYHQYTNWYIGVAVRTNYKNCMFYTSVNTRENSLYGEFINIGEAYNNMGLYYKIKNCRVGLSMLFPFSNEWNAGSERLSSIVYFNSWTHIKDNGHMLVLNFAWNVNYGKKHQTGEKTLNNSDKDSGIVK